MNKKIIACFMVTTLTCCTALADTFTFAPARPLSVDEERAALKEQSYGELRHIKLKLVTKVTNERGYLDLTGANLPPPPYLVPLSTNRSEQLDNIDNLIDSDIENTALIDQTKALAAKKQNGIKAIFSEIQLSNREGTCKANPITETMYQAEVHVFTLSCVDSASIGKPKINTKFFVGYGTDFYLHMFDLKLTEIDALSDKSITTRVPKVPNSTNVDLSLKITFKPI